MTDFVQPFDLELDFEENSEENANSDGLDDDESAWKPPPVEEWSRGEDSIDVYIKKIDNLGVALI